MTHTLGPWAVHPVDDTIVIDTDHNEVAMMQGSYDLNWSEMEANARLISAAPDLLNALKVVLLTDSEKDRDGWLDALMLANDAIRKAEGIVDWHHP